MTYKKTSGSRRQLKKRRVLIFFIYILAIFIFQEIAFRLCFPLPEIKNFNRINYQIIAKTSQKTNYIRNIRMVWKSAPDTNAEFVHYLNCYGYRDDNWKIKKDKDKKRIMFVGDSFVEGMMAVQDEVITSGFENRAADLDVNVEAMNFGMMGVGLNEFLKLIVDATPIFKPDDIFLVLCYNDIPFNKPFKPFKQLKPQYFNLYKPRLVEIISLLKKDIKIPFRWGLKKKPFYPAVPSRNNPWTFYGDSLIKHVKPAIASAMKKGDFNFFRTNWVLEEEKFLKAPADLSRQLKALKNFTDDNNVGLFVYYIPSRHQISNYYYQFEKEYCLKLCPDKLDLTTEKYHIHRKMLAEKCKDLGIPFFDLTPIFKAEEDKGNHLYWNYDDHIRGKGYLLIGRSMFDWWNGDSTSIATN